MGTTKCLIAALSHRDGRMPDWLPMGALRYVAHIELGVSIRAIARAHRCHASTILRQIRRWENQRDDDLIDEALCRLGRSIMDAVQRNGLKEYPDKSFHIPEDGFCPDDETFTADARRVLRRLCEPGAVLAVAAEMDKAVVVRDGASGTTTRTAVVERDVAQALALKEWIRCSEPGRIARYHITPAGRSALNQMLAEAENAAVQGMAEAPQAFVPQGGKPATGDTRARFSPGDSPMLALARRRDRDGKNFLSDELVSAGERLREDFELSHMGPRTTQNWESFLTGPGNGAAGPGDSLGGSSAARDRVAAALRDLGPGLGDVVLRCCCFLEGLEQTEKHMGWSARSGKIVLRIALQRLKAHYEGLGDAGGLMG